jgi:hypothetical protein
MHHIITKTLLLLAIVLAIVSMATPDWTLLDTSAAGVNVKATAGLFRKCVGGSTAGTKISSCETIQDSDKVPDIKACQGLAISSVVFLAIAMACDFVPLNEFKQCRLVGAGSFLIGLVLMIACVSLYAAKVHHSDAMGGKSGKYGYSFYLMVAAIVLAAGAGGAAVVAHHKEMS